jgi:hypothetical protein
MFRGSRGVSMKRSGWCSVASHVQRKFITKELMSGQFVVDASCIKVGFFPMYNADRAFRTSVGHSNALFCRTIFFMARLLPLTACGRDHAGLQSGKRRCRMATGIAEAGVMSR